MARIIKSAEDKASNCEPFERSALERFVHSAESVEGGFDPAALVLDAKAQAEQLLEEAREQGLREGLETGLDQARAETAAALQSLENAASAIQQAREEFLGSLEPQVLQLVKIIVERVVRRELREDTGIVLSTIRGALQNVLEREHTALHLNPEDINALNTLGIDLAHEFGKFERLEIVSDETVGRGGCAVETRTLSVDARLDRQLQRIFDALTDETR